MSVVPDSNKPQPRRSSLAPSVRSFEVVNAMLFPADRNDAVIPSSMQTRLLAYLLVSVGVAVGAVLLGRDRSWPAGRTPQAQS